MQAVRYFADTDVCEKYMWSIKWPDGNFTCPACGSDRIGEVKTRRLIRYCGASNGSVPLVSV